jgi:hypothetical protein
VPVYLLDTDVPENVAWGPAGLRSAFPGALRLTNGSPRFARHRPGSKPSTTEETIIAEGPARCEVIPSNP